MSEITFFQEIRELSKVKTAEKVISLRNMVKNKIRENATEGYSQLSSYIEDDYLPLFEEIFKPLIEQGFKVKFEHNHFLDSGSMFKRDGFFIIKW